MPEAIRNLKKCDDNPDMQVTRDTGGGRELLDMRASWPCLKVRTPLTVECLRIKYKFINAKNTGC